MVQQLAVPNGCRSSPAPRRPAPATAPGRRPAARAASAGSRSRRAAVSTLGQGVARRRVEAARPAGRRSPAPSRPGRPSRRRGRAVRLWHRRRRGVAPSAAHSAGRRVGGDRSGIGYFGYVGLLGSQAPISRLSGSGSRPAHPTRRSMPHGARVAPEGRLTAYRRGIGADHDDQVRRGCECATAARQAARRSSSSLGGAGGHLRHEHRRMRADGGGDEWHGLNVIRRDWSLRAILRRRFGTGMVTVGRRRSTRTGSAPVTMPWGNFAVRWRRTAGYPIPRTPGARMGT